MEPGAAVLFKKNTPQGVTPLGRLGGQAVAWDPWAMG